MVHVRNTACMLLWMYQLSITFIIDIRDYVNGIGNRSREQYVCIERWPRTPCYSEVDGFVELYVL